MRPNFMVRLYAGAAAMESVGPGCYHAKAQLAFWLGIERSSSPEFEGIPMPRFRPPVHRAAPPPDSPAPAKGTAVATNDSFADNLEQTQETIQKPHIVSRADLTEVHKLAGELIGELEGVPDGDMVGEIIDNALKLLRDQTNRGDIKLLNKSLKEIRYALKVFAPYRETRKVSIFGSARTAETQPDYQSAAEFGKAMGRLGGWSLPAPAAGSWRPGTGARGPNPRSGWPSACPTNRRPTHSSPTIPS
jgi:hypothetical protein